jgi:chromosome segregation ATPase
LIETQKLNIKLLQDELGEEAEFDAEEIAQMRSIRRECETRINQHDDRMVQLQSAMQRDIDKQVALLKKVTKERDDARNEANESQQSAINMFNEQKRHVSQMDRMIDEVHRANNAVDKMRDEAVRLRSKINDLRVERSTMKKQQESRVAED